MKAKSLAIFAGGCLTGGVIAGFYFNRKYKKLADKEIASVKEAFSPEVKDEIKKKAEEIKKKVDSKEEPSTNNKVTVDDTSSSIASLYSEPKEEKTQTTYNKFFIEPEKTDAKSEEIVEYPEPYLIEACDCIEGDPFDSYEVSDLTIYADGIVTDDMDAYLNDKYEYIPKKIYDEFMNSDEPFTYIRNERLKINFVVSKDSRTYSEVLENIPPNSRF